MKNQKKYIKPNLLAVLAVILLLAGILFINRLYVHEQQSLLKERDDALFSLAYSVDRNMMQKMDELVSELQYVIQKPEFQEAEESMSVNQDTDEIRDFFAASHLFTKTALEGVVVLDAEGNQVFTLNRHTGSTGNQYTFLKDTDNDELFVCYDEEKKYSVAIEEKSEYFRYYVLFDLNHFYDSIIPDEMQESNWVVFYEPESGLLLQNHDNQEPWMVLTEQEIADRGDGYSIILKNELKNQKGAETYIYPNYTGKSVHERIISLPQKMTQNGFFCIGISRDSEILYGELNSLRNMTYLIMALLLGGGILISSYILVFRQNSLMRQKEMEAEIRENELHVALKEAQEQNSIRQLQPHFLYNALSSIREIVMESPDYAADLLLDFTNYLRACLRSMTSGELIPFEQELKNIQAYVNIEKMRLGDSLTVEYDIQEKDFTIISLGVQPLAENSIRHGISKKRGKTGTVRIRTFRSDDFIVIQVEDDGTGFDAVKKKQEIEQGKCDSTGLKNLILRYRETMHAEVEVESEIGKGTRVSVKIPVRESQED